MSAEPFTDEDLAYFKTHVKPQDGWVYDLPFEAWKSLLNRLECAEKAARWFNALSVDNKNCEPYQDYLAWLKASGRSKGERG